MTVKDYREEMNLTQNDVAKSIKISLQQVQKIEQGKILLQDVKFTTVEDLYYLFNTKAISLTDFVRNNDMDIIRKRTKGV